MKNFPYTTVPTGWFQVAWSEDIQPGSVKPMRYFGADLVCYRGESGAVRVFDAYCPHLGAHLGVGGIVEGDDLICPYHHWRWDCDGCNTEIPYSSRTNRSQRLRSWPVREAGGLILVWHDAGANEPDWEPLDIPEADDPEYHKPYPEGTKLWSDRTFQPQVLIENSVDIAHFQYVHRAPMPPEISEYEEGDRTARVVHRYFYGSRGEDGIIRTLEGSMKLDVSGIGLLMARLGDGYHEVAHLTAVTPIDTERSDMRATLWVRKQHASDSGTPSAFAQKIIDTQLISAEPDIRIWENMSFVERPPLTPEESKYYLSLRRWCSRFYPHEPGNGSRAARSSRVASYAGTRVTRVGDEGDGSA